MLFKAKKKVLLNDAYTYVFLYVYVYRLCRIYRRTIFFFYIKVKRNLLTLPFSVNEHIDATDAIYRRRKKSSQILRN